MRLSILMAFHVLSQVLQYDLTIHECWTCFDFLRQEHWQIRHLHVHVGRFCHLHRILLVRWLLLILRPPIVDKGQFEEVFQEVVANVANRIHNPQQMLQSLRTCNRVRYHQVFLLSKNARPAQAIDLHDFLDADMRVDDVLPECFQILGIGHHRSNTDDCNGFKRTLFKSFAWFSVIGCDGHMFTSYIHDALWHHGDRIACIHVDALSSYAC